MNNEPRWITFLADMIMPVFIAILMILAIVLIGTISRKGSRKGSRYATNTSL